MTIHVQFGFSHLKKNHIVPYVKKNVVVATCDFYQHLKFTTITEPSNEHLYNIIIISAPWFLRRRFFLNITHTFKLFTMAPMLNFRSAPKTQICKVLPNEHSFQGWLQWAIFFSEKRLKCEKFTDNSDDSDRYKVMAIAHLTFQVRWTKTVMHAYIIWFLL